MAREQLQAEIQKIEDKRFILSMKDRWTNQDYSTDIVLFTEITRLKKQLANIEVA